MATLGALWSQQLGFTVTATTGEVYTHGLGYTPTIVMLTRFGTVETPAANFCYTAVNTNTLTITGHGAANRLIDILCGSLHSLVR